MTKKKRENQLIVMRVWTAAFGDGKGNDKIIGVEAKSREGARRKLSAMGYGFQLDECGIQQCLIVGDTPKARKALADWRPVTFADSKEIEP